MREISMKRKFEIYNDKSFLACYDMLMTDGGLAYRSDFNNFEIRDVMDSYVNLKLAEMLVNQIITEKQKPFSVIFKNGVKHFKKQNKNLANSMDLLRAIWGEIRIKNRFYSPKIQMLIIAIERMLELAQTMEDGFYPEVVWRAQDKNRLFLYVKRLVQSKRYRALNKQVKKAAKRRFESACEYAFAHLDLMSKMLVVCVDLHFLDKYKHEVDDKEIRRLRESLFEILRRDEQFNCIKGYICKVEEGMDRGPHMHLMLFINGQVKQNASYWARQVGEVWKHDVTLLRGYYHDCHAGNTKYAWRDVGMVRYNDKESVDKLINAITYLTKPDQYFYSKSQIKANMFTKGNWPEARKDKRGRPRKDPNLDYGIFDKAIHLLRLRRPSK